MSTRLCILRWRINDSFTVDIGYGSFEECQQWIMSKGWKPTSRDGKFTKDSNPGQLVWLDLIEPLGERPHWRI